MSYGASKSQTSQGILLYINEGAASPPDWVLIGEPLSLTFSPKNEFDDPTNLQSLAKEYLATLQDPGKLNVDLNRVSTDAGQILLEADFSANPPTRSQYKATFPVNTAAGQTTTGDVYTMLGFVETLAPEVKVNKKVTSKFSLQLTGPITLVVGS